MIKRGTDLEPDDGDNPWMRTVRAGSEAEAIEILPTRGLTYKVDVVVYSPNTRALLDHSAQVSFACRELLPKLWETQGWT